MSRPSAGERQFALRTLDFLFLHGTHALEMHLRFLPSSPFPSLLLLRPFLAGASGAGSAALLVCCSMAASRVAGRGTQNVGLEMAGRALTGERQPPIQRAINQRPERRVGRGARVPGEMGTWLAKLDSSRPLLPSRRREKPITTERPRVPARFQPASDWPAA